MTLANELIRAYLIPAKKTWVPYLEVYHEEREQYDALKYISARIVLTYKFRFAATMTHL